jgi:hypothetical protein
MAVLTKTGWGDNTQGTQFLGHIGGVKVEFVHIDITNEVTASSAIASTLNTLWGVVGQACCSAGCVSGTSSKGISNVSLCAGPQLEISVGDISAGTDSAELHYIAWGW